MKNMNNVINSVVFKPEVFQSIRAGLLNKFYVKGSESHVANIGDGEIVKLVNELGGHLYANVFYRKYISDSFSTEFEFKVQFD